MIESIAKRLDVPVEKFPMNLETHGNTSAASIPVLLDELNRQNRLIPGDVLIPVSYTHLDVYKRQVLKSLQQVIRSMICR